jgi:hypothetical protein
MSLNDELLGLDKKIKYYSLETFKDVPSDPGVYAWFYPLRIIGTDMLRLVDEINFIFNFNHDSASGGNSKMVGSLGWRDYTLETKFTELSTTSSLFAMWNDYISKYSSKDEFPEDSEEVKELKRIIFISSVFLPPLYIGKTNDLHRRCFEHILGSADSNSFHNRFKKHVEYNKDASCRGIEDLLFACINTRDFSSLPQENEELIEKILMNLVKPIFSLK